jgi:hypothetical protein
LETDAEADPHATNATAESIRLRAPAAVRAVVRGRIVKLTTSLSAHAASS